MTVIGLVHRMMGLAGWSLVTTDSSSLWVSGRGGAAGSNMITAGTATGTEITANMIATGIANMIADAASKTQKAEAATAGFHFRGFEVCRYSKTVHDTTIAPWLAS